MLLRGGHIYATGDPFSTAMLIVDGTVAWVGSDGAALAHADGVDVTVDLDGGLVTPAFVDAHVHLTLTGLGLISADLRPARCAADVLAAVANAAANTSGPILGQGWDETNWRDPALPTRSEIDAAAHGRAVFLDRIDGHSSFVSSATVHEFHYVRTLDGWSETGPLSRASHGAVRTAVLDALTDDQRREAQRAALNLAAAQGIASVHECAAPHITGSHDLEVLLADRPAHPIEVIGYWGARGIEAIEFAKALGLAGLAGDLCVDGAFGSRTAWCASPYADDATTSGAAYLGVEELADHLIAATRHGLQAGFHAIGDAAVSAITQALRTTATELDPSDVRVARHRLEHVEAAREQDWQVFADLGVVASMQPGFDAAWGGDQGMYAARLGTSRAFGLNDFAAAARAGVTLAFGSDSPVIEMGPWAAVRAAVHHRSGGSSISTRAAFSAHSRGGRRAAKQDDQGLLTPGSPATFAVWAASELVVQVPDERLSAWSTDPRSGTAGLPVLDLGSPLPTTRATVVAGHVAFTDGLLRENSARS